jgi:eukaryotic-like serine/threonine-protein kinase
VYPGGVPDPLDDLSGVAGTSTVPFEYAPVGTSPRDDSGPQFAAGEVVADRYQVLRFVARGGMGEVYEVEDRELGQRVALKTLRAEGSGHPVAIARLKEEIRLARQVTHPNVCRLHDVGFHGAEPVAPFITMEFLAGTTLEDRVRDGGKLSVAQARPLVEQMAAALSAAHRAGVIHRDFKSQNVVLAGDRAVVTDFGLARAAEDSGDGAKVSKPGMLVGTPAYMAPEQVLGEAITPATDVYALGVVMFEMATGSLPFGGRTPFEVAIQRVNKPAPSARGLVPDLDPAWDALIARCLARRPEDRFADADALLRAMAEARRPRWRRRAVAGVAVAIAVLAGAALLRGSPEPEPAPRRAVAVVGIANATGRADAAWLQAALGEMIAAELAAGGQLRLVSGEAVARMRRELGLAERERLGADALARIRTNLGVDVVVAGSYVVLGAGADARVRVDVRLEDAAGGTSLGAASAAGGQGELFELVSSLGADLRRRLGVSLPAAAELQGVRAVLPTDEEAARLYAEGLALARDYKTVEARAALEKAAALEPEFPLAHARLAELLATDEPAARIEAQRALDTSAGLPREMRLLVEARQAWATRQYRRAAEIYLTLYTFFPDEVAYGYMLARALIRDGRAPEALVTIEELKRKPGLAQTDPMVDLVEARAASKLGDRKRWQAAAARAADKARARGAVSVLADAQMEEGQAWQGLGKPDRAAAAFETGRAIYARLGDRAGLANALVHVGELRAQSGELEAAREMYRQALAMYRELDDDYHRARTTTSVGITFWQEGRLREAGETFEEARRIWSDFGDREGVAWNTSHLGVIAEERGDVATALEHDRRALAIHREIKMRAGEGEALLNQAIALRRLGDLAASERVLAESLAVLRDIGDESGVARALRLTGDIARDRGDAAGARRSYEEGLAIAERLGDRVAGAWMQLALAFLALDDGRAADAAHAARAAADAFAAARVEGEAAASEEVLAEALVAQGNRAGAEAALDRARARARTSERIELRIRSAIAVARVAAAGGDRTGLARLEALVGEPGLAAQPGLALEAGLALAELRADRDGLARVAADASARGYPGFARRAGSIRDRLFER